MDGIRRLAAGALLAALSLAVAVPSASASCAGEPLDFLRDADAAFVGSVADLEESDTVATVDVDSVWKGPDLAPTVVVRVGQQQPPWPLRLFVGVASSGDADLTVGRRYLFLPIGEPLATSSELRANACLIEPFGPRVARAAPADRRAPSPDGIAGVSTATPLWPSGFAWLAPALVAAAAVSFLLVRRRRAAAARR